MCIERKRMTSLVEGVKTRWQKYELFYLTGNTIGQTQKIYFDTTLNRYLNGRRICTRAHIFPASVTAMIRQNR
jgi:hypothetical protein